jgi:hypothetical protein
VVKNPIGTRSLEYKSSRCTKSHQFNDLTYYNGMFYLKYRRTDYQLFQTNVLDHRNEERYAQDKGKILLPRRVFAATREIWGGIRHEPDLTSGAGEHRINGHECYASQNEMIAEEFGSKLCVQKLPAVAVRFFDNLRFMLGICATIQIPLFFFLTLSCGASLMEWHDERIISLPQEPPETRHRP